MIRLAWLLVVVAAVGAVVGSMLLLKSPNPGPFNHGRVKENPAASNGKQVYHLEVGGVQREFIVYRPENLSATAEAPVVFVFHGTTGTGEKFYDTTNWKKTADAEGFMTVYPTALKYHVFSEEKVMAGEVKNNVSQYTTKWNAFELPNLLDPAYPDQVLADDVAFTRAMVGFVNENYATDTARFYATGFSNGGQFVTRLAVEMTDVFAAFAPAGAGIVHDQVLAALELNPVADFTPRPVLQTVGEEDPKLTFFLGVTALNMSEAAAVDGDPVKDGFISGFLALEQLKDIVTYELKNGVAHFSYDQKLNSVEGGSYDLLIMPGMGHIYPNGQNYPVDIVKILWPFFAEHSL